MCSTCGCSGEGSGTRISLVPAHRHAHTDDHDHEHEAGHGQGHGHGHGHGHQPEPTVAETRTILLEQEILAKNDGLAATNRHRLQERGITAVNLMSSPGSGKTTLLESTVRAYAGRRETLVIEGDQE